MSFEFAPAGAADDDDDAAAIGSDCCAESRCVRSVILRCISRNSDSGTDTTGTKFALGSGDGPDPGAGVVERLLPPRVDGPLRPDGGG